MTVMKQRPGHIPMKLACDVLGFNRSTVYARQRRKTLPDPEARSRTRAPQPRALSDAERQAILVQLNQPEFWDQTAYQAYYSLLEQGKYIGSLSTLYRVLRKDGQTGERRNQRMPQSHEIPRLTATRPNEVLSI